MSVVAEILPKTAAMRATRGRRLNPGEYVRTAGIVVGGGPYSYEGFEFQQQIMEDDHPVQVLQKAAQIGASEIMAIRAIYVADHLGLTSLYYLDNDKKARTFSKKRIQRLINRSPEIKAHIGETYSWEHMDLGDGSIQVMGMFSEANVITAPGDYVIRDEVDRSKQDHSEFVKDRIMASTLQWDHALSQPSFPGYGINKMFVPSDQHYWHLICPACGHENCLEKEFPANFMEIPQNRLKSYPDGATHYRGCLNCGAELDMKKGRWEAHRPGRDVRGYHISQLYTQIEPPKKKAPNYATFIMRQYQAALKRRLELKRFTISIIGDPYGGDDAKITDDVLRRCEIEHGFICQSGYGHFMGVDVGDLLHIAINRRVGSDLDWVWFEITDKWGRLPELMRKYGIAGCVIDAMPYKRSAKEFAVNFRDRVWIQYFSPVKELTVGSELFENKVPIQNVKVDRTESLDATVDMLVIVEMYLPAMERLSPAEKAIREDVDAHLKMLITETTEDPSGNMRRTYLDHVDNHFGMAMNSGRIAALELGIRGPSTTVLPKYVGWGEM